MSEGWGDINAFMLSAREDDANAPFNTNYSGAYSLAGYVTFNFYNGIRRAPYSTDFNLNAFTFKHISDGEPTPDGGDGATNSSVRPRGIQQQLQQGRLKVRPIEHGLTEWPTVLAVETAHLDPTAVLTAPPAAHRSAAGEFAYRRDRTGASVGGHDRVPEAASDRGGDLEADIEAGGGTREGECHGSRGDPGSASDQACCVTHLAEALRAADLRAVDLRGDDLRGVDFWGVDLRGVDFWGVDFWGAVAGRAASAPLDR